MKSVTTTNASAWVMWNGSKQSPQYIVMKNQSGLPYRWIVTEELETMYEVVCERDKSWITHVGKDKVSYRENRMSIDFQTGYCDRTIDISNRNGKFGFTSLGMCISLEC